MTKQVLFYEKAVPVSRQRHGDWSVKAGSDYGYSRTVNSVPLMAVEFRRAASEYPIVFAGNEETVMPVVVLGAQKDQNLYVAENGTWKAEYVPAFVRRYPFVFASNDQGARFTLCIDEEFAGCNREGRGERLFDTDGERTTYLNNVMNFLQEYQAQFRRTQAFCKRLKDLELLEPMQATFSGPQRERRAVTGFMAISREKLKALPGDTLAEMARTDELELAYLELSSMNNFKAMLERGAPMATVAEGLASAPASEGEAPGGGEEAEKHVH